MRKTLTMAVVVLLLGAFPAMAQTAVRPSTPNESPAGLRKKGQELFRSSRGKNPEALTLLRKAADSGDPVAQMWMANLCWWSGGPGSDQVKARAREFAKAGLPGAKRLAEAGDPDAQYLYGFALREAIGTSLNEKEGVKWMLSAAEKGQWPAVRFVGSFYHWGVGVEPDREKAAQWYRKSEALGDSHSDEMNYLKPVTSEHPFKADAIWRMPYVALFGTRMEDLPKAAVAAGVVPKDAVPSFIPSTEQADECRYTKNGLAFSPRFGHVWTVEIYAEGVNGFGRFTGALPLGLTWDDTMESAWKKLGQPDDAGDTPDEAFGMAYIVNNITLAVMFQREMPKRVKLVRIYARWAPTPQERKALVEPSPFKVEYDHVGPWSVTP